MLGLVKAAVSVNSKPRRSLIEWVLWLALSRELVQRFMAVPFMYATVSLCELAICVIAIGGRTSDFSGIVFC